MVLRMLFVIIIVNSIHIVYQATQCDSTWWCVIFGFIGIMGLLIGIVGGLGCMVGAIT